MKIGLPKEITPGENRVALSPDAVLRLRKLGFEKILVEAGAGAAAHFPDSAYQAEGAELTANVQDLWRAADLVLKVQPPTLAEADALRVGANLICFVWPARNTSLLERLSQRQATVLGMDCVPRISRAQKLDALSSMANIAGYRAVIEAATLYGSFFTGQITAAGKIPPAKVLVIGAGVAGLSAIGAARGLGAIVRAFDTRPEVKDQVRSMGAEFLELKFEEEGSGEGGYAKVMSEAFIAAEMALLKAQAQDVDIIITTALVPGTKAPILITEDMVRVMRQGSVVVDLAAEQGGNCALTVPGEVVNRHGVQIAGYTDLPSRLPTQASQLFANNLVNLLADMCKGGPFKVDQSDEVVRGALILQQGNLVWPPPKTASKPAVTKPAKTPSPVPPTKIEGPKPLLSKKTWLGFASVALLFGFIGYLAPAAFLGHFTVFVLACCIGWQVVWNVTPALHTPLMSVTNAISGIIVVGAILQTDGTLDSSVSTQAVLGAVATLIATVNVAGGFYVTHRMLSMFRK